MIILAEIFRRFPQTSKPEQYPKLVDDWFKAHFFKLINYYRAPLSAKYLS
jgi:hypothetical protein